MKIRKTYLYPFILATAILLITTGFRVVYVTGPNTDQTKFQSIKKNDSDLPGLKIFTFQAKESKTLPGLSAEKASGYNCSGTILDKDKINRLAAVSLFYQNGCYTDGQYNNSNYKVDFGTVGDANNEQHFDAYKVYGPANKATKFLASNHCLYYQFPSKENYTVYELLGEKIAKIKEIDLNEINVDQFVQIKDLTVSSIVGFRILFFVPSSITISQYTKISATVEGARVMKTSFFDIDKYRFQCGYRPFDSELDKSKGRIFFPLVVNNQQISTIWQDQENQHILLSIFGNDLKSESTIKLPNTNKAKLIAATNDNSGNYYYCTLQANSNENADDILTLYKVNSNGQLLAKEMPETSKSGLNLYRFEHYMADLQYLDGNLGLFIARIMHKSSDGLNHQGGIAVVFDANSLKVVRNFGQTSGHSFDNYLTINSNNQFMGIDLGDNYPRGINLHKFTPTQINSKIIYTFKTEHGTSETSPAGAKYPFYPEISSSTKKYYKWSNDNGTYTSLGALIEVDNGYVVMFTGEPDANGKSINNSRVGDQNNDPRNIGFIKIVKDFENKGGPGSVVSDDMVLSKGISETGGFYAFGGFWSEQRNVGVQWLTSYKDKSKSSVDNLKAAKLQDNSILLLWDLMAIDGYNSNYISTYAMKIDNNGKKLSEPIQIASHVRLNKRDDLLAVGNKVFVVSGSQIEKKLELIVFEMK